MATAAITAERENYLNQEYGIRSWLLTVDHKRIALLYLLSITFFFFMEGVFCPADPPGIANAGGRLSASRHLQQAFHHARTGHGVFFPDSIHPHRSGEFLRATDDRRQRPCIPSHQSLELVSVHHRRNPDAALHPDRQPQNTGWTFYTPFSTAFSNTKVIEAGLSIFMVRFS